MRLSADAKAEGEKLAGARQEGVTMEKVIGMMPFERSPMIRGHHSSINKAVEAHRQMVEQRQTRQSERREMALLAQQPATVDTVWASQATEEGVSADTGTDYQMYENTLIESPATQAKMATIQSFQTTEPDRPLMGEPVPKGSYLDVEI